MPSNLEIKLPLKNFDEVLKRIKENNCEFKAELNQKDVYYKVKGKLLKLRIENSSCSLIKYLRDEKAKDRFSNYEVLHISNSNAEDYFSDIFESYAVVEKKRLLYLYDNTRIHLDEVKNLGKFLELETLVLNGEEDAIKRFNNVVDFLSLDVDSQIKGSYKDLILGLISKK
jgi:predicted adenylyl cyclase CyaB